MPGKFGYVLILGPLFWECPTLEFYPFYLGQFWLVGNFFNPKMLNMIKIAIIVFNAKFG
jgi:hypothetical protein